MVHKAVASSWKYICCCCCLVISHVWLFATPWTVAHQAPPPGKSTGVGGHFLLHGIFLTQRSNLCLLHWQVDSLPLTHQGSPEIRDVEPEIKLPTPTGSSKKQESSRKTSTSALLTMPKPLTAWITTNYGKFFKRWEYHTTWPASWEICMQVKKQQL